MSSLERTRLDDGESGDMWNAGMSHAHPRATCEWEMSASSSRNVQEADDLAYKEFDTEFAMCFEWNARRVFWVVWQRDKVIGSTLRRRCEPLRTAAIRVGYVLDPIPFSSTQGMQDARQHRPPL
jgi:hypothetical protein